MSTIDVLELRKNLPAILSVNEVAAITQRHRNTISRYIKTGKLKARRISGGRNWYITREDLLSALLLEGGIDEH